ncbi:type II and III secretion system protein [Rickettsiales bacterium]|nr:type II and III secretion system protein [Rickettsiales bacterium]
MSKSMDIQSEGTTPSEQWDYMNKKDKGLLLGRRFHSKKHAEFRMNALSKQRQQALSEDQAQNQHPLPLPLDAQSDHGQIAEIDAEVDVDIDNAVGLPMAMPEVLLPNDNFGTEKLISLSLSESTLVRDVMLEIARLADLNIFIDPEIDSSVLLQMKDRPLDEVIRAISETAHLRYSINNEIIYVEKDTPTSKHYFVDFLNITRSTKGSFDISTKVLSGGGGGGGEGGISSGSESAISAEYKGNLWESLEQNLKLIFDKATSGEDEYYAINKEAGVITVRARDCLQKCVQDYLDKVRLISSAQVLIEAKIVEVSLSDEFRAGVNWSYTATQPSGAEAKTTVEMSNKPKLGTQKASNFNFKLKPVLSGGTLEMGLDLLAEFGKVKTISSPRLHAINNQQAVLTFAKNHVYFKLDIKEESTTKDSSSVTKKDVTVNSTPNTVPIGAILMIQPSINLETQEVTLSVRPTLSRITQQVSDPAVEYIVATKDKKISSLFPVVEVRELDSMLKIRSGDVMLIGGLIEHRDEQFEAGIPILKDFPLFGNLFKVRQRIGRAVETVILLKATIISPSGSGVEVYSDYKFL